MVIKKYFWIFEWLTKLIFFFVSNSKSKDLPSWLNNSAMSEDELTVRICCWRDLWPYWPPHSVTLLDRRELSSLQVGKNHYSNDIRVRKINFNFYLQLVHETSFQIVFQFQRNHFFSNNIVKQIFVLLYYSTENIFLKIFLQCG